jgi:5-formyltetrahydrofolate cyclo-ligase
MNEMSAPATGKDALRASLREARSQFTPEERLQASADMRARLISSALWQSARSVLLFAPLADEPDLWPLLEGALTAGKQTCLPRFSPPAGCYEPAQVRSLECVLHIGQFGIREPAAHCPAIPVNQLDLALAPGVAFDAGGHRLGRGRGYYDRLLEPFAGVAAGVAFDWQILERVPVEPHDRRLDVIVTPTRWLDVTGRART